MADLPTVGTLNSLTASQNALLLLRVLGTSDLTFFGSLLERSSCADIVKVCRGLLEIDGMDAGLSDVERAEFAMLLELVRGS